MVWEQYAEWICEKEEEIFQFSPITLAAVKHAVDHVQPLAEPKVENFGSSSGRAAAAAQVGLVSDEDDGDFAVVLRECIDDT